MTRYYNSSQHTRRSSSVTHQIFSTTHLVLFAVLVLSVTSCEKGPTTIGNKLLPGSDFVTIKSVDTITARSFTMYDDSVRTDNPTVSYIGEIYDPYFGTTTAGLVTQVRLGSKWQGETVTVDSVKLFLHLLDVKGSAPDALHTISLSEISDQIYTDQAYYSNQQVGLTGYSITGIELPALKADTINDITINLPVSFGQYLIRDTTKLLYSSSKPDFKGYFKGLYFQMDPSSNPLLISLSVAPTTQLGSYNNMISVFLHTDLGVKFEYFFILDASNRNAAYNKFSHDFNTAVPSKKIQHINDGYRDTLSYLQYLNGLYTRIKIPGLANLKSNPDFKNIAINKARLIVPVYLDGDLYKVSTVPSPLILRYRTKSGTKYVVPDYGVDQYHSFFDGTLDTTKHVYNFNLATYIQGYFEDATGELLPELEMYQGNTARNVILKANNSKTPVKFEFTYTKF